MLVYLRLLYCKNLSWYHMLCFIKSNLTLSHSTASGAGKTSHWLSCENAQWVCVAKWKFQLLHTLWRHMMLQSDSMPILCWLAVWGRICIFFQNPCQHQSSYIWKRGFLLIIHSFKVHFSNPQSVFWNICWNRLELWKLHGVFFMKQCNTHSEGTWCCKGQLCCLKPAKL